MNLAELKEAYKARKLAFDTAKKEEEKYKALLKDAMLEAGESDYTDEAGYRFERIVQERKSMDEEKLLAELRERNLTSCIKTVEAVDEDATLKAVEAGELPQEVLADPIKIEQVAQNKNVVTKVIEFSKKNRKVIIIGTAVAGTIVAGNFVHQKIKNREPKVMKRYHAALRSYIEDIRNGELSMKSINRLMDALEELKQDKRYEMLKIELTTEELDVLVNRIYEYTVKLASDNAVELTDDEKKSSDNSILNLQRYLKTQKRIFKSVA